MSHKIGITACSNPMHPSFSADLARLCQILRELGFDPVLSPCLYDNGSGFSGTGATKCGALFGEAVVLTADSLKKRFKAYMKQNGAVLAKGWLLGLQFHCLLGHDLYFTATRRADELAMKLRKAFAAQGIPFWVESFTNQQFVILTDAQKETLEKRYIFEPMGKSADGGNIARFCTSWATTEEEVQTLIDDLKAL